MRDDERIRRATYLVRLYCRPHQRELRAAALEELGRACREAFNQAADQVDQVELVLVAIVDGLSPRPRDF